MVVVRKNILVLGYEEFELLSMSHQWVLLRVFAESSFTIYFFANGRGCEDGVATDTAAMFIIL